MQVRIIVTPKGVRRVFLVAPKKRPTIESLAFYAQIESSIEKFKVGVKKALSVNGKESSERKTPRTL